ncbi:MAG: hypothetical protein JO066_05560 [Verrucomicrobia bacterium]|nr:hypothetical protein [Verrucomicrobiota bacterium]
MKIGILFLLFASAVSLYAQADLPDVEIYNYLPSQRDPFISARAPTTLLNERVEIAGVASEDLMRRFLEKLTASIHEQLSVGGLSTDGRQPDAIAVINGIAFRQGDTIPLEVDQKSLRELDQLAQSFGLKLTRTAENSIAIEVGRISPLGVAFMLPGFRASICQMPLERDDTVNLLKLERKPKEKKP